MKKEYGELMSFLLHHKERYDSEEDFRGFITDCVRTFARDLRDFNVEIALRPDVLPKRSSRDWNYLKIGCE